MDPFPPAVEKKYSDAVIGPEVLCYDCYWKEEPAICVMRFLEGNIWYGACMTCVRKYSKKSMLGGIQVRRFEQNWVWIFKKGALV